MNRIVILEDYAIEPGDLDWSALTVLGQTERWGRTPQAEAAGRIGDAPFVILNKVVVDRALLAACPGLRWIGLTATGTDNVDLEACSARGVAVANVPGYSTASVAQMAFALLLELCQCPGRCDAAVRRGYWKQGRPADWGVWPQRELAGKTLGVVGYGDIGRRVAAIGRAFGMEVLVHTRTVRPQWAGDGVSFVSLPELLRRADAVSLHVPATAQTAGMIDGEALALCKRGVLFVNTARGALVDEQAMADALASGQVGGFGTDVQAVEPPRGTDGPLFGAPNTVLTPHSAWTTPEALARLAGETCRNLESFLAGENRNVVNPI